MRRNSGYRGGQERIVLWIVGWVVVVAVGFGLVWLGYALGKRRQAPVEETAGPSPAATAVAPASPLVTPTEVSAAVPTSVPTITPLPTMMPTPTPAPVTDTPAVAMVEAGSDGLNIRSGPGLNFTLLAHVDPGSKYEVVGYYDDWWQIDYEGTLAWVANWVVTASNADNVAEVVPPASPVPQPTAVPTATPVPATPAPAATPTPDTRGVVVNSFVVENAPGPYGNAGDIWFNIDITNGTGGKLVLTKIGAWVEERDEFQVSWGAADPLELNRGQNFTWRDHLYPKQIPVAGTYHIWLRVCFTDGSCLNVEGPVKVIIG